MLRVLVSSCLLGEPVRYDGTAAPSRSPVLAGWLQEQRVLSFCPEVAAGLATPRSPVELVGGDRLVQARAVTSTGEDLTTAFLAGAQAAVALCQRWGVQVAVLKERSPSCGSTCIHDGTFSNRLRAGRGFTTVALEQHGVAVFPEDQWEQAQAHLAELEQQADHSAVMASPAVHQKNHPED